MRLDNRGQGVKRTCPSTPRLARDRLAQGRREAGEEVEGSGKPSGVAENCNLTSILVSDRACYAAPVGHGRVIGNVRVNQRGIHYGRKFLASKVGKE